MKTIDLEEVKNAVAKLHGYKNWKDVTPHYALSLIDEVAEQYAKQRCDEQIKACADEIKDNISGFGNAILSTPNVVTIDL